MIATIICLITAVAAFHPFGLRPLNLQRHTNSEPSRADGDLDQVLADITTLRQRSTCFEDASIGMLHACSHSDVGIDETSKARYAIDLTRCELQLAKTPAPAACYDPAHPAALDQCLIALQASPQFWTSFSGYFRDVRHLHTPSNRSIDC